MQHPASNAPGTCSGNAPSNARTYGRTYEQLLTFGSNLALGNAHRGGSENSPAAIEFVRPSEALRALLGPRTGDRFDVVRTRHTAHRDPIGADVRACVKARDHHACCWCGATSRLVMDHVVPWSAGGSDSINNLRTLCWDCNASRSNFAHPADLLWRPVPFAWACVDCCRTDDELASAIVEFGPTTGVVFCFWCHVKALGWASDEPIEVAHV